MSWRVKTLKNRSLKPFSVLPPDITFNKPQKLCLWSFEDVQLEVGSLLF